MLPCLSRRFQRLSFISLRFSSFLSVFFVFFSFSLSSFLSFFFVSDRWIMVECGGSISFELEEMVEHVSLLIHEQYVLRVIRELVWYFAASRLSYVVFLILSRSILQQFVNKYIFVFVKFIFRSSISDALNIFYEKRRKWFYRWRLVKGNVWV